MATQLKVFIIYASEDRALKDELLKHLKPMQNRKEVEIWDDSKISGGEEWEKVIFQNLSSADIILPLVSSAFYASDYINHKEMREAITRYYNQEILLLPIVVRPCDWQEDSLFKQLQMLPKGGEPVIGKFWHNQDEAWLDVIFGIRAAIPKWQHEKERNHRTAICRPILAV